jgi:hypothetical protein
MLSLVMTFAFLATAFAADFSDNAESDLKSISNEIVTTVNELYGDENNIITAADIDYKKAFKVYVDTDVFKLSTNNASELESTLESGNYIYVLPISTNNGTIVANIQKGLPLNDNARAVLTKEEQQEVLSKVGQWVVSSVAFYNSGDTRYDYSNSLSDKVGDIPDGTMLVGSLPIFHDVVALIPGDDGMVESLVPVTESTYEAEQISKAENSSNVYDYQQVKEYASQLPTENSDLAGGTGITVTTNSFMVVVTIVLLVAFVTGSLHFFNRRRDNN